MTPSRRQSGRRHLLGSVLWHLPRRNTPTVSRVLALTRLHFGGSPWWGRRPGGLAPRLPLLKRPPPTEVREGGPNPDGLGRDSSVPSEGALALRVAAAEGEVAADAQDVLHRGELAGADAPGGQ